MDACSICAGILPKGRTTYCSVKCQRARGRKTVTCECCGIVTRNNRFCSRSCSAKVTNAQSPRRARIVRQCVQCHRDTYNFKYCGRDDCVNPYSYEQYIKAWLTGNETGSLNNGEPTSFVRRWVRNRDENKCIQCGWCEIHPVTGRVPLAMDHIDGNASNNRPENLRMLCPNCHSLTPTFGNLNRGRGRGSRRKGT